MDNIIAPGPRVAVIIDAFRAFATACFILKQQPKSYYLTARCGAVQRLQKQEQNSILVGKPEINSFLPYTMPNSPTRVLEWNMKNRTIIHRTAAGGAGVRYAKGVDILLAASFVNAKATADAVIHLNPSELTIYPLGHEGRTPTLEDDLCASYLEALIEGRVFELAPYIDQLRKGPGRYFFSENQEEYPREDFDYCLASNTFDSPIFVENCGDFAILATKGVTSSNPSMSEMMSERIPFP